MSIFNKAKSDQRKAAKALVRAARERGMTVEELAASLTPQQLLELSGRAVSGPPPVDMARFGLPPHDAITMDAVITDEVVADALTAAQRGEWAPAAELVAATWQDWDRRYFVVRKLADLAATDDAWLDAWHHARPDDPDVAVVHADSLVRLAWNVRGSQAGERTTAEQFAGFHDVLVRAYAAAVTACELRPDDPTPRVSQLTAARGLGMPNDEFEVLWRELTRLAPLHRSGHTSALQYWCEKWHGSHEQMFAFADAAFAASPRLAALSIDAAFEYWVRSDDDSVWQSERVRRAVDTALTELAAGEDRPSRRDDLGLAAYGAVRCGRGAEAVPLFAELDTSADAQPWTLMGDPITTFNAYRILACRAAGA